MFEEVDRAPLRFKLLLEKILMTFLDTLAPTHSLKLCIYIAIILSSSKNILFFVSNVYIFNEIFRFFIRTIFPVSFNSFVTEIPTI